MTRMKQILTAALAVAALGAASLAAPSASAEPTGSTCSDCPWYMGKYSIENTALFEIEYQFKWGESQDWRTVVLSSGARKTHSYNLGNDRDGLAPTPFVRFRKTNGKWSQVFRMRFHAVMVEPGYGGTLSGRKPKRYELMYTGDFQQIELVQL